MELTQLKTELIAYYGKHKSEYVQNVTMEYIEGNYREKILSKLHLAILKSHPHSWGFPDVSAIETAADRFEISENTTIRVKKEKTEYKADLSITDEEWQKGFSGMEVLKKAVEIGFHDKIAEKDNNKLDPEIMENVKRELRNERD